MMKRAKPLDSIPEDFSKAVFSGETAREQYINPENHPMLPLVELTHSTLNPFKKYGVRIFAKDLRFPPLGNVKSGAVYEMGIRNNKLPEARAIHEATSQNTGIAVSLLLRGKPIIYVPPGTSEEKILLLQICGAQVIVSDIGIRKAKENGNILGNQSLNQYENPSNPDFFYRFVGPQVWQQTQENITLFCAGLGTTGTMVGISRYLKKQNPHLKSIGVIVKEGEAVPGVRTIIRLKEIKHDWQSVVDYIQYVGSLDSYLKSLELIRHATIFAGPSSGFALMGLHLELKSMLKEKTLDKFRNSYGEVVAVFTVADSPYIYIHEYHKILGKKFFQSVISDK